MNNPKDKVSKCCEICSPYGTSMCYQDTCPCHTPAEPKGRSWQEKMDKGIEYIKTQDLKLFKRIMEITADLIGQKKKREHICCDHCEPLETGHAPHSKGCPRSTSEERKQIGGILSEE